MAVVPRGSLFFCCRSLWTLTLLCVQLLASPESYSSIGSSQVVGETWANVVTSAAATVVDGVGHILERTERGDGVDAFPRPLMLDNDLGKTPQMGWNSWNHFGCAVTEDIVRKAADALVDTGLAAAGYTYVNVDDCWANLQRDPKGQLVARSETFPSGIKALADYVHSKGLKFGIYSDAGFLTCAMQPGSLGYEQEDALTIASWGVDYLKYDNCFNDLTPDPVRYAVMRDALNATGRPIFYSICDWGLELPALWGGSIGNSWRTTADIQDTWDSMMSNVDNNNRWARFAGPGHWNDPDMLEVGNGGMSESEYRVHFSLWALMKAPLLLGCDLQSLSASTQNILLNKEAIAINQDALGIQGRRLSRNPLEETEVWGGPLTNGRVVVALVNRSPNGGSLRVSASWTILGLPLSSPMQVRDVWKHKTWEGDVTGSLSAKVPSHDVALLLLSPP
eukprot:TRINITY_DN11078_c0_g1_i2.p1 TRINITY_DN11078_c0_g1~~TRINITY_DN11078_c0_g1_i2.p1  ORF type:complete len:450 (+),score=94.28 TRINITY_DN11078_c0_g1_i2:97-1446(+)